MQYVHKTLSICLSLFCLLELFQADVDEFCQYYGRRDGGLCFPDFQRKPPRSQESNYLGDEKIEDISRFVACLHLFEVIYVVLYRIIIFNLIILKT